MITAYMLVITALVVGCTANPKPLQLGPSQSLYSGYDIDRLMENKTLYVGNTSKVVGLLDGMPEPAVLNGMALQTTAKPYGITVNYVISHSDEGEIDGEIFYRNSILLLSLIDNVDIITYSIFDSPSQNNIVNSFTITRKQADN